MSKKKSTSARVSRPERQQVEMHFHALDEMLPKDHRARLVWQFVESLDLEPFYAEIRVSDSQAGHPAIAPEILLGLWLLATLDGISSAREVERRSKSDFAYMWICGHVGVNHHTLSDFRVNHADKLDQILTQTITVLMAQDLVPLQTLAQDGMRVRAHAGSGSFRRKPSLKQLQRVAKQHVKQLREESENEAERLQGDARRQAAQERAAKEREERIQRALEQIEELSEQREKRQRGDGEKTRCSTTDPEARRMKMGDGGFRPAYNVQFATDGDSRVIVGVEVTQDGTDARQLPPMLKQIEQRYDTVPEQTVVDSAYVTQESIQQAEQGGTKVISTIPRAEKLVQQGKDPHARQPGDSDEYAMFRARMKEDQYKELYKQRPSIAEFPNADCRNRGLHQFRVRGLIKAKAVALWHALAFNLMRMQHLGAIRQT